MDDDTVMRTHRWAATALTCLALTGIAAASASAAPAFAGDDSMTDSAFLRAAHQGSLTEIAAGQDARKNATTDCVKRVAAVLVREHTELDADTGVLADKLGVDLPLAPTVEQQQTLAGLMAKAGTSAYDTAWLKALSAAHQATLDRIDKQLARGENTEVTTAAKATRPIVAGHLALLRGGACRADTAATTDTPKAIRAGSGGQAATFAAGMPLAVAVPAIAVGGVVIAGGAFWAASRLRRNDLR